MYSFDPQFVSPTETGITSFGSRFCDVDVDNYPTIITDVASWSSIKEKNNVQEDELEKFVKEYQQFANEKRQICHDPACYRYIHNLGCEIPEPKKQCFKGHKKHDRYQPGNGEEGNKISEENTQKWIWEQTEPFLKKRFPVSQKPDLDEEQKAFIATRCAKYKEDREKELEPPGEDAPWFSSMYKKEISQDAIEREVFDPLRKSDVCIRDVKYPVKILVKKVEKLVQERQKEFDKRNEKDTQEYLRSKEKGLAKHKEKFVAVLAELLKESFEEITHDDARVPSLEIEMVDVV